MLQLIECPSMYELMGCPDFHWQNIPVLELWREKHDSDGKSHMILESYTPGDSIGILKESLANNKVSYKLCLSLHARSLEQNLIMFKAFMNLNLLFV